MKFDISFKLGEVDVNPLEYTLQLGEQKLTLQPKFIEVLAYLAQQHPELVTRQQIIDEIWDGNGYVGEKALTNAIWHLRKSLKKLDPENEYIETIRKTGYRILFEPQYPEPEVEPSYNRKMASLLIAGVFVLSGLFAYILWPEPVELSYQEPELVTQYPGRELFPSVSNDGRFLAYSWRQMDRSIDLFVKDLSQPDLPHKNVTFSEGSESRSAWSADDNTLFYYRRNKEGCQIVGKSMVDSSVTIYGQCSRRNSSDVAASRDGKYLAFIGIDEQNTSRGIYLKELNSERAPTRLACELDCDSSAAESLAFSPNSRQLVFSRNLTNSYEDIYIYDLDTNKERKLVSGYLDVRGIDWHPVDATIAFAAIENGIRNGYEVDVTTGEITKLDMTGFSYPAYGKDNILYYHNWNIDTSIMRLELDSDVASSPFPLLQSEFNYSHPDFSATAEQLAFISNESGYDEVWLSSLDGVERRPLTKLKQNSRRPSWSKDGKHIAFTAIANGENRLYVVNVQTQQLQQIKSGLSYHNKPSWSHDNEHVYVSDSDFVYRININSHAAQKVTEGRFAIETQNNKLIVNRSNVGIWQYDMTSDSATQLFEVALASSTGWQYTNEGIYYFKVRGYDYRLSFYDFSSGQHRDMLRVPERSFSRSRGMTFEPTNKWLLFTGYESPEVDVKRVVKQ